jgi:hypothetical protein
MSDGSIAIQQVKEGGDARSDVAAAPSDSHGRRCDVSHVAVAIEELHELVARRRVRVEITRAGCDDCCVLISRQELDALERALAIVADTDGVKAVCERISELAAVSRAEFATIP